MHTKKIYGIIAIAVLTAALFMCACGSCGGEASGDTEDSAPSVTATNPNDDGFGTEVEM